ncbi:MAG: DegT/DnrJ/EryC1/StrS family aminotransferase [Candidatus Sumerlaeia bacterium]|nr:DegT/DnrJ/EryC1/StrS family aminotransferase [Candidatus Sumerlaeia bacterium]
MNRVPFLDLAALNGSMDPEIRAAMDLVLEHGRYINGPEVGAFEEEWGRYCGTLRAIGAANGTAALHAILQVMELGPGDEVILPSHTFIATAESVLLTGAKPVFVDILPDTWLIDPEAVREAISPRTRAIIPVHLYGMPADMEALNAIGCEQGISVVEDASQAHGAVYKGSRTGSLGHAAAFSFFPGKNLGALGDAGGITTVDEELARRLRLFVNHGREGKYEHEIFGTNYRLDTLQAAVLRVKLAVLDEWNARRRELAALYREILSQDVYTESGLEIQADTKGADSAWHLFVISIPGRDAIIDALSRRGISTGMHYPIPCHLQPSLAKVSPAMGSLPVTEKLCSNLLSLPICPTLDAATIEHVCDELRDILESNEVSS